MNRAARMLLLTLLLSLAMGVVAAEAGAAVFPGTIWGGVNGDSVSLQGVDISVFSATDFSLVATGTSGVDGLYSIPVPYGSYLVYYDAEQYNLLNGTLYMSNWWQSRATSATADAILVSDINPSQLISPILAQYNRISGTVTDIYSGSRLPSVTVTVRDDIGSVLATAITDGSGDYITPRVPLHDKMVWTQFTPAGYNAEHPNGPNYAGGWGGPNIDQFGPTAYIAAGAADAAVNAQLTPYRILGTVYDGDYATVSNVEVQLWTDGSLVATTVTNAQGEYWLYPTAGTHKVYFDPAAHNTISNRYPPLEPDWYQSKEDSATADTLTVNEAAPTAGAYCVLGVRTIAAFFSRDADGAEVRLCELDGSVVSTATVVAGKAVFSPVPDGEYRVYLDMTPYNVAYGTSYISGWWTGNYGQPSPAISGSVSIEPLGDFVYSLWFDVTEFAHLTGSLTLEGWTPIEGVDVEVWDASSIVASAATAADGSFNVSVVPGTQVRVHYDARSYNASAAMDVSGGWYSQYGPVIYDNAQVFYPEPGAIHDVSAQLPRYWGVDGVVTDSNGVALANTGVVAKTRLKAGYPSELGWLNTLPPAEGETDPYGRYEIDLNNIVSTDYAEWIEAVSLEFRPPTNIHVKEFYNDRALEASADPVPVAVGVSVQANAALESAGRITGTVMGDGVPLRLSEVTAYDQNDQVAGTATADEMGSYTISGLRAGTYHVKFDPQPYVDHILSWYSVRLYYSTTWWNGRDDISIADPVEVRAGETTTGINAELTEAIGQVRGAVHDESSAAVAGVSVSADKLETYWDPEHETYGSYWAPFDGATTAADGSYRFDRLPEGHYRLNFDAPPDAELASEYYDDAHDVSEADTLTVVSGSDIAGIDATLQPVGVVSGVVVDELSGEPVDQVPVVAMLFQNGMWQPWQSVETGLDGRYRLAIDVQENMRLVFGSPDSDVFSAGGMWYASESWNDSPTVSSAHDFPMTYSAEFTADATISPCATLSGHLTYDMEATQVDIEALRFNGSGWEVASVAHQEVVQIIDWEMWTIEEIPNGDYTFRGLKPGTYRIRFRRVSGPNATGYYRGVPDVSDAQDITVSAGQVVTGIDDTLTVGGALSGQVKVLTGEPNGGAVSLFRKSADGWEYDSHQWLGGAATDFLFSGLRAGQYTLIAGMTDFLPEAWNNRSAPGFVVAAPHNFTPPEGVDLIEVQGGGAVTVMPSAIILQADTVLDALPPVSTCVLPAVWTNEPVVPVITAVDSAGTPFETYSGLRDEPLALRSVLPTVSAEGLTAVRYYSVDAFGNREDTKTAQVRIDLSPPVTADDALPSYRNKAIVQFFASDALSGPYDTHYVLDGGTEMIGLAAVTTLPGEHTLSYWSVDRAGNVEEPNMVTFFIGEDMTPPSTVASAPAGWTRAPATVELSATDAVSGVDAIYYSTDGTTPKYVYYRPLSISEHGRTVITYRAVDLYGNPETIHYLELDVDARAPQTTAAVIHGTEEATVTLQPADEGAGVARSVWKLDGGVETSGTLIPISTPGTHTIVYRSMDAVGNAEDWNTLEVNVPYACSIRTTISATSVTYPSKITLTGRLFDSSEATVTGKTLFVEYSYNGTSWARLTTATPSGDSFVFSAVPSRPIYYRMVLAAAFAGPMHTATNSTASLVTVRAGLSTPYTPSVVYRNRTFSFYTYVRPRHTTGITFWFYRYESGKWILRKKVYAAYVHVNSTTTKAYRTAALPYAGRWRVRAYHAPDVHPASYSAYRYFTVK